MEKWILSYDEFNIKKNAKRESLWTQGNGYMGIRAAFEEKYIGEMRTTLINGIFNAAINETPEIVVLPDTTNCEIQVDGERFSLLSGKVEDFSTSLNMKTGEFKRSLIWTSNGGNRIKFDFFRFVSDKRCHIIAQKVKITSLNKDCKISLITGIDGKNTNSGVQHCLNPQKRVYDDGIRGLYTTTMESRVQIAVHYKLISNKKYKGRTITDRRSLYTELIYDALKDESIIVEKISSFASSRDFEYNPEYGSSESVINDGKRYLTDAAMLGYDRLFEESKTSVLKFWTDNEFTIECENSFLSKAAVFAQYHLYIMASRNDNRLGIGAKALTGEGYKGHSYWDTELFLLPYYIYNAPHIAKNLLAYRYNLLDVSEEKAKKYGYEGAMYPWESAWVTDGEASSEYGGLDIVTGKMKRMWFSEKEIHVTSAIAYGVWHYYCATGDDKFMEDMGNEIVVLSALFWLSRVKKVNGRYEILDVIGPDEYKSNVDNNAYTNYMALHNMRFAQKILKDCPEKLHNKLSIKYNLEDIKNRLNDVVQNIYLPKAEEDGIISQFDGCKNLIEVDLSPYKNIDKVATIFDHFGNKELQERQMYKQADLVMLFYLMEDMFTKDEICKNYTYYEKRTLHDSSLSMCIHSLVAARCGMKEIAKDMFYKACCVDLGENTDNSDTGVHAASLGGIWLMLVQGYGGLDINEKGLFLNPILPDGWKEYVFYVHYKGSKLKVMVNNKGCFIERIFGDSVEIFLDGKETKI